MDAVYYKKFAIDENCRGDGISRLDAEAIVQILKNQDEILKQLKVITAFINEKSNNQDIVL